MARINLERIKAVIKNHYCNDNNGIVIQVQMIIAIIGSVLLIAGVYLPVYKARFIGVIPYSQVGKYYDEVIVSLAIVSILIALLKFYRWLLLTSLASLSVILYSFYNIFSKVEELRLRIEEKLYNNPYRGLLNMIIDSIQQSATLQWGVIVLAIGIVLLIISALVKSKDIIIPLSCKT